AQVLLIDPRRMRDRAAELIDEEASLASTLAKTWGADATTEFPRLHLPFERLLEHTHAPVWSVAANADSPDTPSIAAHGWDPVVGDATRLVKQLNDLRHDGYRIVICADGEGSAARIAAALRDEGFDPPPIEVQP